MSGEPVSPVAVAEIDCVPTVAPSVQLVDTKPDPSLTPLSDDSDPPPLTTVKVTVVPVTPFPPGSVTCTTTGEPSAAPASPV